MIYALDVDYNADENAIVACIGFKNWDDAEPSYMKTHYIESIEPYKAGSFFKRELPCLLEALKDLKNIDAVIVDGYVWLEEPSHYGLGMYLYDALEKKVPIVGVAKNKFNNTPVECEVFRGKSTKPLYVTSIDLEQDEVKKFVLQMHGKYRFPTLLKEVDSLCRGR